MSRTAQTQPDTRRLPLDEIVADPELRVRDLIPSRVHLYAEERVFEKDPITVYGVDGHNYVIDGFHRHEAAMRAHVPDIPVIFVADRTWKQAVIDAALANAKRGFEMDGAALVLACERVLVADPHRPNEQLADELGRSARWVAKQRAVLLKAGKIENVPHVIRSNRRPYPRAEVSLGEKIAEDFVTHPKDTNVDRGKRLGCSEGDVRYHREKLEEEERLVAKPGDPALRSSSLGEHRTRRKRLIWMELHAPEPPKLIGRLIKSDCVEVMTKDRREYDAIIVDPPYGVAKGEWDPTDEETLREFTRRWLAVALPRLKATGRMFVFWTQQYWHVLVPLVREIAPELVFEGAVIWEHSDTIRRHYTEKNLKLNYTPVLHWRGADADQYFHDDPWPGNKRRGSIWASQRDFGLLHSAEKPLDIVEDLIRISTYPGDWVLDPFVGSGTTAVAAQRLGRKWIGIDLFGVDALDPDADTRKMAQQRIALEGVDGLEWRDGIREAEVIKRYEKWLAKAKKGDA